MAITSLLGAQTPALTGVCPEGLHSAPQAKSSAKCSSYNFFLSPPSSPFPHLLPAEQLGCCFPVSFIFVNTLSGLENQIVSFKFNLNFCLKNQPETSKRIQKMHCKINDQMTSENIALLYLEIWDQNSNFFYC